MFVLKMFLVFQRIALDVSSGFGPILLIIITGVGWVVGEETTLENLMMRTRDCIKTDLAQIEPAIPKFKSGYFLSKIVFL